MSEGRPMPEQMAIRIGSLFSGIGGLEMGLERATGGRVAWQVEQDEWCRRVLARHWPEAERFDDVRKVGAHNLAPVEVICGGFPCQDISVAGKGAGLAGERSGLWFEYARIVRELRPRAVVVENVSALLVRGLDVVLGDLAALGYDAIWDCVPAAAVGAPHRRDRLFVIAWRMGDAQGERRRSGRLSVREGEALAFAGVTGELAHARDDGREGCATGGARTGEQSGRDADGRSAAVADADREWQPQPRRSERDERGRALDGGEELVDAASGGVRLGRASRGVGQPAQRGESDRSSAAEPGLGRAVAGFSTGLDRVRGAGHRWPARPGEAQHPWEAPRTARGVTDRARRLKALGNAVVPQVAEVIGHVVRELLALESSR